jgi:hypothetical protein
VLAKQAPPPARGQRGNRLQQPDATSSKQSRSLPKPHIRTTNQKAGSSNLSGCTIFPCKSRFLSRGIVLQQFDFTLVLPLVAFQQVPLSRDSDI